MAKVSALPSMAVIDAFRGKLDFYKWCNLTIVRSWPRSPGRQRNAAVTAAQGPFIYINQLAHTLPATVVDAYKLMAQDTSFSWKDFLNRFYINGALHDHLIPPEN